MILERNKMMGEYRTENNVHNGCGKEYAYGNVRTKPADLAKVQKNRSGVEYEKNRRTGGAFTAAALHQCKNDFFCLY